MAETAAPRKALLTRFLSVIERGGNALPHPATLFAIMALLVIVVSGIALYSGSILPLRMIHRRRCTLTPSALSMSLKRKSAMVKNTSRVVPPSTCISW